MDLIANETIKHSKSFYSIESINTLDIFKGLTLGSIITFFIAKLHNKKINNFRNWKIYQSALPLFITLQINVVVIFIIVPWLAIFLCVFYVYRLFVRILLLLKHKQKYQGLLSGPDILWIIKDDSKPVINALIIIKHRAEEKFSAIIIKRFQRIAKQPRTWKMRCQWSSFMGYAYLLKCDCVMPFKHLDKKSYLNNESLQTTLSTLSTKTIEKGYLWEVYIGDEQIDWGTQRNCYPLIVRVHHALGDSLALMQLLQELVASDQRKVNGLDVQLEKQQTHEECDSDEGFAQNMIRISIRLMHFALMCYKLPKGIFDLLSRPRDVNQWHDVTRKYGLSGEKVVVWKVENGFKYVQRVRAIKKRFAGIGFFDVIAAAIGYALDRNLAQNEHARCENVSIAVAAIAHSERFVNMHRSKLTELANRFSFGTFNLPLAMAHCGEKRLKYSQRCALTAKKIYDLKTGYEFQLNYLLLNMIMEVIPVPILQPLLIEHLKLSTGVITNLPGPRRLYLDKKGVSAVKDIVFWVPQRGLTGISISVFTYEGRLQLGASIDKSCKISKQQAEVILENIFAYIDSLYDELGT